MLKIHPYAELLPMPSDADMQTLVNSIKSHGQLVPIMVLDGYIVDGRSRYFACNELGISPKTAEWVGPSQPDDLINAVIQLNLARRHLTMSQKMAVAANAMEAFEVEAKERMLAGGVQIVAQGETEAETGRSRAFAAKAFNLNHSYVQIAKNIKRDLPELHKAMLADDIKSVDAIKEYKNHREAENAKALNEEIPLMVVTAPAAQPKTPSLQVPRASEYGIWLFGPEDKINEIADRANAEQQPYMLAALQNGKWNAEFYGCKK